MRRYVLACHQFRSIAYYLYLGVLYIELHLFTGFMTRFPSTLDAHVMSRSI